MNTIRHSTLVIALLVGLAGTTQAQAQELQSDPANATVANGNVDVDVDVDPTDTAPAAAVQLDPSVPHPVPVHPELKGVFADFGGEAGLTALMDDFMAIMLEDPRMRPFFEKVDHVRVKRQLVEQVCGILGGGCTYSGRDMKTAHAGLGIDRADFNALVEDLQLAMNRRGIPFRSQNKLLAVLAPMHREMIER